MTALSGSGSVVAAVAEGMVMVPLLAPTEVVVRTAAGAALQQSRGLTAGRSSRWIGAPMVSWPQVGFVDSKHVFDGLKIK